MNANAAHASSASTRRAYWLKTLHQWHWISSALSLVGMLAFAVTGITLNHASQIEAQPRVVNRALQLSPDLLAPLAGEKQSKAPLPPALRGWLAGELKTDLDAREAEWSDEEIYLSLPRPGGDAWLRIDRAGGAVEYELTERGWLSYFNDLHKGRNTGVAWGWFIDAFAVACLVFSITGLLILKLHAVSRPLVWPVTALGLVLPLLLAIVFIH